MKIAILIYDGITALDAVGPYDMLNRVPGKDIRFVAKENGAVRTGSGTLGLVADYASRRRSGDRRHAGAWRLEGIARGDPRSLTQGMVLCRGQDHAMDDIGL